MKVADVLDNDKMNMVTMLINGEQITDIAKKLKRSRQTIYDWMKLESVKAELDRRRRDMAHQGNNYIMKDLTTYIDNIKALANDKTDKRVALSANQYLLNRIYGNPTNVVEDNTEDTGDNVDNNVLETQLNEFKKLKRVK